MSSLLPAIELETAANPDAAIIWMHGLGADGNDFVPIVDEMELPARPIRFIFPHAPVQPVTINGGFQMRAWYDVVSDDFSRREDEGGVRDSQGAIEALIRRENERGIPARQIVLAGFSQGGAMALHTGLRYPERLAGIMALSTYVPISKTLAAEAAEANRDVPIFMAHGTGDPVIPLMLAGASRQLLERLGYDVQWHEYAMGHSVMWEEVADISRWLGAVLLTRESDAR
jgi:phospholipase/carboxylesterase